MMRAQMTELEMIEAFGNLEGLSKERIDNIWDPYNPIRDLLLNCKAREKYNVSVVYMAFKSLSDCVSISTDFMVYPLNKEDIPKCVIECILKSEGCWIE